METLFSAQVIQDFHQHALESYPNIAVGFIARGIYVPCSTATPPADKEWGSWNVTIEHPKLAELRARSAVLFYVYSRPLMMEYPNRYEMQMQVQSDIPWIFVYTDGIVCHNPILWGVGAPILPLVGRPYRFGITDCYSLCKDYFRLHCDIQMAEYPRNWQSWLSNNDDGLIGPAENSYLDNFINEGFVEISDVTSIEQLKLHDFILYSISGNGIYSHSGVYIGNNQMMHQIAAKVPIDFHHVSKIVSCDVWMNKFDYIVTRHKKYL